ncbi:MAG: LysM peptidoglycan-binding domain-containing protein [Caldilineaceae bacterium]
MQLSTIDALFAQSNVHVVQPGDSLSVIAARYGINMGDLAAANGISNNDHVWVGQRLIIPGVSAGGGGWSGGSTGRTVTVGRGDSLSLIAALNGMTVQS